VRPALLQVRDAAFSYGERLIFESLDLDVYAGEVLTILGTNGSGKSTLLRCIAGILPLNRGKVSIGPDELASLSPQLRARRIGFLFQDHAPSFPFTVLQVALMGRTPYLSTFGTPSRKDVALAEQALERVGITHLKSRPYTELSGGERQLVLLSRTLAQQPELILLDEPTAHLDFRNQVRCLQTIGELTAQGVTMIMTTHDPNHAFVLSERVALMKRDAPIAVGPVAEVMTAGNLSDTYGVPVAVFGNPGESGRQFCSPQWEARGHAAAGLL
jgi:iron complex transport system ATP-binding protein